MGGTFTRRQMLAGLPAAMLPIVAAQGTAANRVSPVSTGERVLHPEFPAQEPARVQQMVGASHGNVDVVRSLLRESPALAKATIDWGFGDWETALGAASHVGNREIAGLLMEHGARPDLFTFAMLGQLQVVRSYVEASPGIQKLRGPHGLTLMHHARKGGKDGEAVVAYLEEVGDADIEPTSLPMTDEERDTYVGKYVVEGGDGETFDVAISRTGPLSIKRSSYGASRNLNFLGSHEFAPSGAEAVRIRFGPETGEGRLLTIIDGPVELKAVRT